jgi:hypothetical protein
VGGGGVRLTTEMSHWVALLLLLLLLLLLHWSLVLMLGNSVCLVLSSVAFTFIAVFMQL